jgi:pimeloyl-ACP methyl ester carboxylesterase
MERVRRTQGLPKETSPSDEELRSIATPTCCWGEQSELHDARRVLARTVALMPALEVEIVRRAGHSLPVDQADVVSRKVLQHLAVNDAAEDRWPPSTIGPDDH